jgi:glutamine amidotransferase
VWAFRYPEFNPLHLLEREAGEAKAETIRHEDAAGTMKLSHEAVDTPVVIFASEKISDEPGWEEIGVGELVHVGPDLVVDRETIVSGPPKHLMELHHEAAKSQAYA